jgi:ankyrin repeat protein
VKKTGNGEVAIHLAAKHGHIMILSLLLGSGARVEIKKKNNWKATTLDLVASGEHTDEVKFLLEKGAPTLHSTVGP